MDVSAVWIQDWEGRRITSFGKRLQWDWRWDEKSYPGLDKVIAADENTRWMGYINPYLVESGVLFKAAQEKGYCVKKQDGSDYLFDFGEYDCGVVDLTMPEAFEWYKGVIKTNLIGLGFRGWMADFGEYLPADCVCFGGSGLEMHNKWPMLPRPPPAAAAPRPGCGISDSWLFSFRILSEENVFFSTIRILYDNFAA